MNQPAIPWRRLSLRSRRIKFRIGDIPTGTELRLKIVLGLVALLLGAVIAYLVVSDNSIFALGLILAVPGAILLHNHPILGLATWLMLMPFLVSDGLGPQIRMVYWAIHRGLPLIMVVVISVSAALGVKKRPMPKIGIGEAAMLAYVILSLASITILSDDPSTVVIWYYDRVIVPMFLYLLVRLLAPNEEDLRRLLPLLLFIVLTQTLFGFLYVTARGVLPSGWLSKSGERATGSLGGSESVYTVTVLFSAALSLHIGLARQRWDFWKLLSVAAFGGAMLAVFFSFSRAGWLAMVVLVIGLIYLYPKIMVRLAMVGIPLVLLVVGGLLASQLEQASERLYSSQSEESALSRLPVILASIRMFEEKPAFGWGYANFDRFDREFQGAVSGLYVPDKDHASHNLYLTILAEQGLSGFLTYMLPMVVLIPGSLRKWKTLPRDGLWSRKLLALLWLLLATHVVVNNFSNMRIVFGLGLWWMTVALVAVMVLGPDRQKQSHAARLAALDNKPSET